MIKYIPNILTISRFIGIFPLLLSIYNQNWSVSLVLFIVLALTDTLDGYIARRYKFITIFGQIFDPIVDKIFVITTLFAIIDVLKLNIFLLFLLLLIIIRDIVVTLIRIYSLKHKIVLQSEKLGQVKAWIQMAGIISILLYLVNNYFVGLLWIGLILIIVSTFLSLVSGYQIIFQSHSTNLKK